MAAKVFWGSNQEGPLDNAFAIAGEIAFPVAGEGVVAAAADEESSCILTPFLDSSIAQTIARFGSTILFFHPAIHWCAAWWAHTAPAIFIT